MPTDHELTFSVIVPTYNRPERVRECLKALCALDYPVDAYEIIIVDDGSDTPLDSAIEPYLADYNVRLLRQENAGPASARNFGAREARGRYLAFTDDDCCPAADWLKEFERHISSNSDVMVGGSTVNQLTGNLYSEASETLLQALYAFSNQNRENGRFFASNNICLSREQFHTFGGFDTSFPLAAAEDRDFCDRWTFEVGRLVWEPRAKVYHSHGHTFWSFLRQHRNYGRGAVVYHRLRKQRGSSDLKDDVGFHTRFLHWLSGPLSHHNTSRAAILFCLVLVTQVAYVWGYVHERILSSN